MVTMSVNVTLPGPQQASLEVTGLSENCVNQLQYLMHFKKKTTTTTCPFSVDEDKEKVFLWVYVDLDV